MVMMLRFNGLAVDPERIRHQFGTIIRVPEILRCAKELGLKARLVRTNWSRLARLPMPALAILREDRFLIFGKATEERTVEDETVDGVGRHEPIVHPLAQTHAITVAAGRACARVQPAGGAPAACRMKSATASACETRER